MSRDNSRDVSCSPGVPELFIVLATQNQFEQ